MIGRFELDKIYNEDCYKAIKDIPDNSIDCIYTDIPYLYNKCGGGNSELGCRIANKAIQLMGIKDKCETNKDTKISETLRIAKNISKISLECISMVDGIDYDILNEYVRVMKHINIFIWCSKLQILDIMNYFLNGNIDKKISFEILTWNKTNPTPSANNTWLPDIEYCLYFREMGGVLLNSGYELKSKYYVSPLNKRNKDMFEHPTIKPLPLVERHLKHATQWGDTILDTFIGSGTTAVACKNTGRHYLGFEIDKHWWEIANNRLNNIDANGQMSLFTM